MTSPPRLSRATAGASRPRPRRGPCSGSRDRGYCLLLTCFWPPSAIRNRHSREPRLPGKTKPTGVSAHAAGQATSGMRFLKSDSRLIGVLLVLAITQLIGWGTIGLPAVVGRDLGGRSRPEPAGGVCGQLGALCHHGPVRALARQGFCTARRAQGDDGGHCCLRAGLCRSVFAREPISISSAWVILGMGGSATLSTGAYIMLNEVAGRRPRTRLAG